MFEFISKRASSKEAFEKINNFYDGWFTSRGLTYNDVLDYFPNADDFDRDTLFSGMLWMYYNYPMDYLYKKNKNISGHTLYRRANLMRITCFLYNAEVDGFEDIIYTLAESSLHGEYPSYKTDEMAIGAEYEIDYIADPDNFIMTADEIIANKYLIHPLSRKMRSGARVPVVLLKRRTSPRVLFTKKAIDIDNELMPALFLSLGKWEGLRDVKEDVEVRLSEIIKAPIGELQLHLLDQVPMENIPGHVPVIQTRKIVGQEMDVIMGFEPEVKASEKKSELRHVVTKKAFVPYHEEIGFDIDPNVIAQKISDISSSEGEELFEWTSSSKRSSSNRSDFSTESFLQSDNPSDDYIVI